MRSIRWLVGAGKRALAARLDRLEVSLGVLKDKMRGVVAQLVGEMVGATVRETLLAAVSDEDPDGSYSYYFPSRHPSSGYWQDPDESPYSGDAYGPNRYGREQEQFEAEYQETETNSPGGNPSRLAVAISTGLRGAAWWVRHWWSQGVLLAAGLLGLLVGGAAYWRAGVVGTVLGLVETVEYLSALNETARRGVSGRSASRYP